MMTNDNPITLKAADRGICVGANGTGKSTLCDYLIRSFKLDYPNGRVLVLDTKPRWRATRLTDGTKPTRLYSSLSAGDTLPGSMAISNPKDWQLAWDHGTNPSQVVIAQRLNGRHNTNMMFQIWCAEKFFLTQKAKTPSLVYFDEGHDFFHQSASAYGGSDIVQRCFRAGRERNLASLIGAQRSVGINLQCLTETNYCALFRINYAKDVQRLREMGWPEGELPPTYEQDHVFKLWRNGNPSVKSYKLTVKGK